MCSEVPMAPHYANSIYIMVKSLTEKPNVELSVYFYIPLSKSIYIANILVYVQQNNNLYAWWEKMCHPAFYPKLNSYRVYGYRGILKH